MEGNLKLEQVGLISDLMQGKELAKKLHDLMFSSSSSTSHETKEVLLDKIFVSYEKALTKLNWEANVGEEDTKITIFKMMDSPCSFTNESPRGEVFNQEVKHKNVSKKRKTMDSWTKQMKVCPGTVLDGSLGDGYNWRKYGQKDILGAKFPRGYYRCTHRHAQGCLATKQVQKSDEETTYEITYKGRHTCIQSSHAKKAFPSKSKICIGENKHHNHQKKIALEEKKIEQQQTQDTAFTFGPELEVKIDLENKEDIFPSFFFPSPSIGSETMIENHFTESFSPAFLSPSTSESNIFCLSPCNFGSIGLGLSVQTSESDITDIVSATTSVNNSPIANLDDLDLFFDNVDFDTDFPINTPEYFTL
ncbi:putative transcription factor WRKY family [Lupinus albus]|uniref:Putative transcription factor WRKY family n=1 Tax=Lupinus albus TaxID=3870 RepID=A0A6A4P7Q3_LUPAL|nr:putative transcription factor WRKY family [Lupinus albus]